MTKANNIEIVRLNDCVFGLRPLSPHFKGGSVWDLSSACKTCQAVLKN